MEGISIPVPAIGPEELPQTSLSDQRLKEVVQGVLIPSQAFSKAMARCVINMRLKVDPSSPIAL